MREILVYKPVRVNTDFLFDAAIRFERLALSAEDIAADVYAVMAEIKDVDVHVESMADRLRRKADDLVFRMHNASAVLKFAAGRYEDFSQRMKYDFELETEEE